MFLHNLEKLYTYHFKYLTRWNRRKMPQTPKVLRWKPDLPETSFLCHQTVFTHRSVPDWTFRRDQKSFSSKVQFLARVWCLNVVRLINVFSEYSTGQNSLIESSSILIDKANSFVLQNLPHAQPHTCTQLLWLQQHPFVQNERHIDCFGNEVTFETTRT